MDWTIILIGNIIMDSTIAIFVIMVAIESYYLRLSTTFLYARDSLIKVKKNFEEIKNLKNKRDFNSKNGKIFFESIKLMAEKNDKHIQLSEEYLKKFEKKSLYLSPFKPTRIFMFIISFFSGILIQLFGIFTTL